MTKNWKISERWCQMLSLFKINHQTYYINFMNFSCLSGWIKTSDALTKTDVTFSHFETKHNLLCWALLLLLLLIDNSNMFFFKGSVSVLCCSPAMPHALHEVFDKHVVFVCCFLFLPSVQCSHTLIALGQAVFSAFIVFHVSLLFLPHTASDPPPSTAHCRFSV